MYSLIYMERTISCETAREIVDLVEETTNRQVSTMLTKEASDKEFAKAFKKPTPRASAAGKRKKVTAAAKKARAAKARASYQKKKAAQQRYLTKKAAEDAVKAPEPTTTAEKHHGQKEKRADTGGDIISALRRSGLPLTIPEIRDDLQRSGWKYNGPDPKGTIRATLNRLVTKGEVAKGSSNGALTFRIARVEHADPLPHQQRESDV
jgi:hypothetical protein